MLKLQSGHLLELLHQHKAARTVRMVEADNAGVRILVVEDDDLQREVLQSLLTWRGYTVDVANSGVDAVLLARSGHYDMMLIDYQLPDTNGHAVARLMRDSKRSANRPRLVALTASIEQLPPKDPTGANVFDCTVIKPTHLNDLMATIERELLAGKGHANPTTPPAARSSTTGSRILIVEDDPVQQVVLRHALERQGWQVDAASDGFAAVCLVETHDYSLVLLDYLMPGMDGIATARLLRGLHGEMPLPHMIALTSNPQRIDVDEYISGEDPLFDEVISKSVDLPDLVATLGRHLRADRRSAILWPA